MTQLRSLACPNCGASLPGAVMQNGVAACEFCGTSFRVAASPTPEPDLGDLILGADFSDAGVPGWALSTPENLEFKPGDPPELWARFPASSQIHPVIRTPAYFDNCDAGVTVRFVEGDTEYVSAGLEARGSDAGDYTFRISAQGTFQVAWHDKNDWGGTLLNWTAHPALKPGLGPANRLRILLRGEQIRVYLNGVLATSLRDSRFSGGTLRVMITPGKRKPAVAAYSRLELRDVS